MHTVLPIVLGFKCFVLLCVSHCKILISPGKIHNPLSLFLFSDHTLGLFVITMACGPVYVRTLVCLKKKQRWRENTDPIRFFFFKSTEANGKEEEKEEEGVFVIYLLCGGSRQVPVSLLVLFTRQAEWGAEICRKLMLKENSLSETANMRLINTPSCPLCHTANVCDAND